jgi:hypothetical protein
MATSFKKDLLEALHNFLATGGSTFRIALVRPSSTGTYGAATTAYTQLTGNSDEATGTGYTAGGAALTRINPTTSGTTAFTDFNDVTFTTATLSAEGALIYNDTLAGKNAVSAHSFGGTRTSTAGDYVLQFPTPDAAQAILRLA